VVLADDKVFGCWSFDALAAKLVWARQREGQSAVGLH
jgi:hypothetical protein